MEKADGPHSSAVSPVWTKINKILVARYMAHGSNSSGTHHPLAFHILEKSLADNKRQKHLHRPRGYTIMREIFPITMESQTPKTNVIVPIKEI